MGGGLNLVTFVAILGSGLAIHRVANFDDNSICGDTYHLSKSDSVDVKRDDETSGYCGIIFHAMTGTNYTCNQVCVKVTGRAINDCHARLTLTGIKFSTKEDPPKEMSCFERLPQEFCFDTSTMRVELVRDLQYPHAKLDIAMTVTPKCVPTETYQKQLEAEEAATWQSHKEVSHTNMVRGIVTGVCLCCIFLIILLITWCYYQNSANRGKRYDYPSVRISKRPTLAGFKAKLNFKNGGATGSKSDAPQETYTVTNENYSKEKKGENLPLIKTNEADNTVEELLDDTVGGNDTEEAEACDQKTVEPSASSEPESSPAQPETDYAPATIETTCTDSYGDSGAGSGGGDAGGDTCGGGGGDD